MHPDGAALTWKRDTGASASVRLDLKPTAGDIRNALDVARRWWEDADIGRPCRERAELVLAEILNNVVEHAHADSPDGAVVLEILRSPDSILLRVRDNGRPMPGGRIPAVRPPDPLDLPEGGFGWFLISQLADEVRYIRIGDANCLSVRIETGGAFGTVPSVG